MIALTQEMAERINSALANRTPCILATASPEGQPDVGPKGSMMVFDREHLAYWERARRGLLENVQGNPKVTVFYWDPPARVHWRFHGVATVHKEGAMRDQIMARTVKAELDRDPERRGYGVLNPSGQDHEFGRACPSAAGVGGLAYRITPTLNSPPQGGEGLITSPFKGEG